MTTKRTLSCLLVAILAASSGIFAAPAAEPVKLTADGEKLLAKYTEMLEGLRADITKSLPAIKDKDSKAFMEAFAAVGKAEGNPRNVPEVAAILPKIKEAQDNTLNLARPILADLKGFLASDKLDTALVKCAVLANATPRGLAEFAQRGSTEKKLVDELLSDMGLMKEMLEAGGATMGRYGEAMRIYTGIMKASKRAGKPGILHRMAFGTSVELALPVVERSRTNTKDMERKNVDAVRRYMHYENAYLDGELDPAFKTLTAWECRFIPICEAPDEELAWGREMLRTYRPDHIFTGDYRWRYSKSVKTDVKYGGKNPSDPELGFFQDILNTGGVCGKRAFFGRFILRSFGIPTFGMTQRGHAATGHWTPDGWTVNFGAHWTWSWWAKRGHNRSGLDFLLETQARRYPKDYMKVLRAEWVSDALGEAKASRRKLAAGGSGGLWDGLSLYQKKAIVAEAKPVEVALAGEDIAEANESTKAEQIIKAKITPQDKKIVIGPDGTINIPAVACSKPTDNTAKIAFMRSFSGGMQLHHNRLGKPEPFEYTLKVPQAGIYKLTAQVATVNKDQQLTLTLNGGKKTTEIALPYTVGLWQQSKPVEVNLAKGVNVMHFSRNEPNYGLTIKKFTLTPSKDAVALPAAEKLVAEKQYLKAAAALRQLIVAKPGTDIAKQAADRLKALQDDPAIGRSIIDAEADAFEGRCAAAQKKKDYVLAIKLYEQYVGQFPKASRLAKVKATLESLKSDKAIQATIKTAQVDADCRGWMSLADNYAKLGLNEKAREYLSRIVDKYGDTDWGAKARARLAEIPAR